MGQYFFLYLISIVFILYVTISWIKPEPSKITKRKIRQSFYAIWTLFFAIFFNNNNQAGLTVQPNKIGAPKELLIFFWYFVLFGLVAILIDIFIISGKEIKSVKKDGIDIAENTEVVMEQKHLIEMYEQKINAEYEIIQEIKKYTSHIKDSMKNTVFNLHRTNNFHPLIELENIIELYFKFQQNNYHYRAIEIGTVLDRENIERIIENNNVLDVLPLKFKEKDRIFSQIANNEGYINTINEEKILMFPYRFDFYQENYILIVIESKYDILKVDQLLLLNILRELDIILTEISDLIIEEYDSGEYDDELIH